MNEIFQIVYKFLKWMSSITGLTYREINILVYFVLIPSLLIYLLGRILKKKFLIIGFLCFVAIGLVIIPDFEKFSSLIFDKSVDFLNWFEIIGLDYIQASVVICVLVPVLLILILLYFRNIRLKLSDVH